MGKATKREYRFSHIVRANTRICGKKNNDGQSLPLEGKVASEASRIGFWRDEKERRRSSQVRRLREYPSAARGPLSQIGKAKRRGLRRPKRKPIPPRCARQPLPREGARVDTPSFLWKEVPRRGGGWMGKRDEKDRGRSSQVRHLRECRCPRQKAFPSRGWNLSQLIACLVTISYNKEKRTEVRKRR